MLAQVLDQKGVGQLVKMATERGRAARPNLKVIAILFYYMEVLAVTYYILELLIMNISIISLFQVSVFNSLGKSFYKVHVATLASQVHFLCS